MRPLLAAAIKDGLVEAKKIRDWPGNTGDRLSGDVGYKAGDWLNALPELIGELRNYLAHGSFSLYPDGGRSLRVVADIINQLYPAYGK